MNRKIEFRGLRTDGKGWVYGFLIRNEKISGIIPDYEISFTCNGNALDFEYIEVHPESVGQFTGLYDKNGVKIFEGDILKYKTSHTKYNEETYFENIVEFACGQSLVGWRMRNKSTCVKATPYKFYSSEVIGNIHENK